MVFLTNINLSGNELQNAIIQPLATAPANPKLGQIYCDSTNSKIMWYNGTKWMTVGVVVESSATNGSIKVDGVEMSVYSLPIASADTLGGVKVGTGLGIGADGKLYVTGDATVNSVDWSVVQDTPTTLAGYGITDAVAKETGKGLSSNDYTTTEKNKLAGIAAGAEVNVKANWNETSTTSDAYILNKPTKLSDFTNDGNFIDSSVNNLANYYLKTETYTQAEVNNLIGQIATIQVQVISSLPNSGQKSNVIYLVAKSETETQNVYDEYLWTGSAFEKIGDTTIDLSGYVEAGGDASSTTVAFTSGTTRGNLATGDSMAVLMGKIKKVFDDLHAVAFSGSYVSLADKPMQIVSTTRTLQAGQTSLNVEWVQDFTVPSTYSSTISMSLVSYKAYIEDTGEEVLIDMAKSLFASDYPNQSQVAGSTDVGAVPPTKTAKGSLSLTFSIAKAYTKNITIDIFAVAQL